MSLLHGESVEFESLVADKNSAYQRMKRNRDKRVAEIRKVINPLKEVPCADCGVTYPWWIMQFDHLDSEKKRKRWMYPPW